MNNLDPTMVWLIGAIVSVLTYIVNFWRRKGGKPIGRVAMTFILYGIAFLLVLGFGVFVLPEFPAWTSIVGDAPVFMAGLVVYIGAILGYLGKLLTLLTVIFGAASAPYELLYKRFFEKIKPLP